MSGSNSNEVRNPNLQRGDSASPNILMPAVMMVLLFFGIHMLFSKENLTSSSSRARASALQQNFNAQPESSLVSAKAQMAPLIESVTTVENQLYRITFTNRGGQVTSWILKRFKDRNGKPLNLVSTQAAQQVGLPLSLYTNDAALTETLNKAFYVSSATGSLAAPASLTFTYSGEGVEVRKTFSFDETYVIHADVEAMRDGAPIRTLISWPVGLGDEDNATDAHLDFSSNGREKHIASKKSSVEIRSTGPSIGSAPATPTSQLFTFPTPLAPQLSLLCTTNSTLPRPSALVLVQASLQKKSLRSPSSVLLSETPAVARRPASTLVPRPSTSSVMSMRPTIPLHSSRC